nr:UDP-2,4-diacetamido-2,4,6-trideoxy-beta-L-altropyranose hydrolase [Paraburkholderia sp. BL8N3]
MNTPKLPAPLTSMPVAVVEKPLRAVFRVDASIQMGSGHVMRCLTLAENLMQHGAEVHFIARAHAGNLVSLIASKGFHCHLLPALPHAAGKQHGQNGSEGQNRHAAWLGCDWKTDCEETSRIIRSLGDVAWLIIDHYALDADWERGQRPNVRRIMVIDDLADRPHECDLLLDQNVLDNDSTRYLDRVPSGSRLLLGPRYALLRPQFLTFRERGKRQGDEAPRLFVFFGGVDATGETGKFLTAWAALERPGLVAEVVLGIRNAQRSAMRQFASGLRGIRIHDHVDNMAELMARADYAFGASGSTVWERFCIGLNSSITSVANNQTELALQLASNDLIDFLGNWTDTTAESYLQALQGLDPGSGLLSRRRARIMQCVDGLGLDRVTRVMLSNTHTPSDCPATANTPDHG